MDSLLELDLKAQSVRKAFSFHPTSKLLLLLVNPRFLPQLQLVPQSTKDDAVRHAEDGISSLLFWA